MVPAITQRFAALGTLCRRHAARLLPVAPFLLLLFHALLLLSSLRGRWNRRFSTTLPSEPLAASERDQSPAVTAGHRTGVARLRLRRTFAAAAAVFGGTLLAASMAGGTYALLNAQRTTPAVTVSSGTLAVTVAAAGTTPGTTTAIPTAAWTNMLPGDVVGQTITVANTGSIGTVLSARLSATTAWDIRIVVGACPATQLPSTPLTTTAVAYGTIAAGSSATVCVQATLPQGTAAATENTAANFMINFDAKQVTP